MFLKILTWLKGILPILKDVSEIAVIMTRHAYDPDVAYAKGEEKLLQKGKERADDMAKAIHDDDGDSVRELLHELRSRGMLDDAESSDGSDNG